MAKPKRRGKKSFSMDSEVFGPAESESEVSFLPKIFPGPQMELLFLLVRNCIKIRSENKQKKMYLKGIVYHGRFAFVSCVVGRDNIVYFHDR